MNPISTSDFSSNVPEQLEYVAKVIGTSPQKLAVFEAVYHHKAKARSVKEIERRTGLSRIQILKVGSVLVAKQVVLLTKRNGDMAYARRAEYHGYKRDILALIKSKTKREKWATKRKVAVTIKVKGAGGLRRPSAKFLTVEDIDSFRKVVKVKGQGYLPKTISENRFKRGVQRIVGEPGEWKDWPGELHDLSTTRLRLKGKRYWAIFAFKGPGMGG